MRSSRAANTAIAIAVIGFIVSSCAADDIPAAPTDDAALVLGQGVYASQCASCHGAAGGGGRGSQLDGPGLLSAYESPEELSDVIANGRNTMPGFGSRLSTEELDAVVRYTREVLNTAPTGE